MKKHNGIILFLSASLTGCNIATMEHYQQTMDAITVSETNLENKINSLNEEILSQKTLLTSLTKEIETLSGELQRINHQIDIKSKPEKPEVVYIEKPVKQQTVDDKVILGEQEWVWLDAANHNFKARIDTGATTSSINANEIQEFERDGKTWIKFSLVIPNIDHPEKSESVSIEAPLTRWARIRQSSTDEIDRRPVVSILIRIGSLHEKAQFTLTNRSHMAFPILLGREFFKDIAVVDVSKSYIHPAFTEK